MKQLPQQRFLNTNVIAGRKELSLYHSWYCLSDNILQTHASPVKIDAQHGT